MVMRTIYMSTHIRFWTLTCCARTHTHTRTQIRVTRLLCAFRARPCNTLHTQVELHYRPQAQDREKRSREETRSVSARRRVPVGSCAEGRAPHERSRRTGVPARRARALASSREGAGRNPSTCRRHQTRENGHTRRRGRLGVVQGAAGGREGSPSFPAEAATAAMAPQSCGAGRGDLGVRKSFPNWGELGLPGEHE